MEISLFHLLKAQPLWILIIFHLGLFTVLKSIVTFLLWLYNISLRPPKDLRSYGSWSLITGSTDGIGKAFAFELAQQGFNLILVGRNPNKLGTVSSEIRAICPTICIKTVVLDFSSEDISIGIRAIEEVVEKVDLGLLINNVGVTYPKAAYFHEVHEQVWMDLVRVNIRGTTMVTEAVIPHMLKKRRGAIVNIGSGASIVVPSHPLYAIYAATKAYVDQLSRSMHAEYKQYGIDVQCQVPLYVATALTLRVAAINKPSVFVPSPEEYAGAAVRWIGYGSRCTPYWSHSLQWYLASFLSESVLDSWRMSIGIQRMKDLAIGDN